MGGLGGVGVGLTKKKVEPQFGVSFGLPYPSGAYPLNTFNGGFPAQNPYFGSISPNGLNLGLLNVNPLVSFQFAKNEYGEKTFKPLVNFHVTPNENIINKVGNLFKAKKFGFGGIGGGGGNGGYNQHYHTHTHFGAQSPPIHHPHHYESGPPSHHFDGPPHHFDGPPHHYESAGPHFESTGPSHYGPPPSDYYPSGYAGGYGFSSPGHYDTSYHGTNNIDSSLATGPSYDFDPNSFYSRSANGSAVSQTYADNFANYKQPNSQQNPQQNFQPSIQQNFQPSLQQNSNIAQAANLQNAQTASGSQSVSFPTNRRKRNTNSNSDDGVKRIEKVIFIVANNQIEHCSLG